MIRSLSALAVITTVAGFAVACDRNDASTTTTTGAPYDAGVIAPEAVPVEKATLNGNGSVAAPGPLAAPRPRAAGTSVQGASPGSRNDPAPMNSPAPMNANTMNNHGALNGNGAMNNVPGGNDVGAVNDGTSAGSMNGTRPMNQLGSTASPYRPSNGATDAPVAPRRVSTPSVP